MCSRDDHRNLVTELAAQAAVAIDNARLFKDREEVIIASLEASPTRWTHAIRTRAATPSASRSTH